MPKDYVAQFFRNLISSLSLLLFLISCAPPDSLGGEALFNSSHSPLQSFIKPGGIILSSNQSSGCANWRVANDALKILGSQPKFCHAAIVLDVQRDYVELIDANPGVGVTKRRKSREELFKQWQRGELASLHTRANAREVEEAALPFIGTKFCWPQNVDYESPRKCLYCSSFVRVVFDKLGIRLKDKLPGLFWISPDDILNSQNAFLIRST